MKEPRALLSAAAAIVDAARAALAAQEGLMLDVELAADLAAAIELEAGNEASSHEAEVPVLDLVGSSMSAVAAWSRGEDAAASRAFHDARAAWYQAIPRSTHAILAFGALGVTEGVMGKLAPETATERALTTGAAVLSAIGRRDARAYLEGLFRMLTAPRADR